MLFRALRGMGGRRRQNDRIEQIPDSAGLDQHAAQTTSEKHDRYRDVLKILGTPRMSPGSQMLEEDIGRAVQENDE